MKTNHTKDEQSEVREIVAKLPRDIHCANAINEYYVLEAITQLVKEVEAGERERVRRGITNYVNEKFLEGVIIDPVELYEALTPPTSDVIEKDEQRLLCSQAHPECDIYHPEGHSIKVR